MTQEQCQRLEKADPVHFEWDGQILLWCADPEENSRQWCLWRDEGAPHPGTTDMAPAMSWWLLGELQKALAAYPKGETLPGVLYDVQELRMSQVSEDVLIELYCELKEQP